MVQVDVIPVPEHQHSHVASLGNLAEEVIFVALHSFLEDAESFIVILFLEKL